MISLSSDNNFIIDLRNFDIKYYIKVSKNKYGDKLFRKNYGKVISGDGRLLIMIIMIYKGYYAFI